MKPEEYAAVASLMAYVILPQDDRDGVPVLRRSNNGTPETVAEALVLPEIGETLPLDALYGP